MCVCVCVCVCARAHVCVCVGGGEGGAKSITYVCLGVEGWGGGRAKSIT